MANSEERKNRILEHVSKSIKLPQQPSSANSEAKKQQIMDHVKRTRN